MASIKRRLEDAIEVIDARLASLKKRRDTISIGFGLVEEAGADEAYKCVTEALQEAEGVICRSSHRQVMTVRACNAE